MQFNAQPNEANKSKPKRNNRAMISKFFVAAFFVGIVGLQAVTLYFVMGLRSDAGASNREIINEVSQLTSVNVAENPTIGIVADAAKLRDENPIHAQVYAAAQDGDYVLAYADKMVIYRRPDKSIVYEGKSPGQILGDSQTNIRNAVIAKAKEEKLLPADSDEQPQLNAVVKPENFTTKDAEFYADIRKDDVVAVFNTAEVIVIYRPATNEIVNSGAFTVSID